MTEREPAPSTGSTAYPPSQGGDAGYTAPDYSAKPVALVLGGGVLFVLGILMWLPLRSHRFLGLLGLLVSGAVIAGLLVPLVDAGWDLGGFGPGFWCGIAVGVLGLLGSLKALLTGRKYAP